MRRILELLKSMLSREDLVDSKLYVQRLGDPVSETRIPKDKLETTILQEDGNKTTINVTEIGQLTCGHWNIDIAGECFICKATFCKLCISEKTAGYMCSCCGRFVCKYHGHPSLIDPEEAYCDVCGLRALLAIIRRKLCKPSRES